MCATLETGENTREVNELPYSTKTPKMAEENSTMGTGKVFNFDECTANLSIGFENLMTIFAMATDAERSNGLSWYSTAYNECVRLADLYNLPLHNVVYCVAAVSPQLRWVHNIIAAETLIRHFVSGGYIPSITPTLDGTMGLKAMAKEEKSNLPSIAANVTSENKIKALWILQGYNALSGAKVTSFADNIMRFENSDAVTVDSHAILAWFGIYTTGSVSIVPSFYTIVAADYRKVAAIVGMSPLECQAVIWIVRRRLAGSDVADLAYI